MKKFFIALLLGLYFVAGLGGCEWMGKTSGQAVQGTKNVYHDTEKGVEDGADDFGKGYDKGEESMKK